MFKNRIIPVLIGLTKKRLLLTRTPIKYRNLEIYRSLAKRKKEKRNIREIYTRERVNYSERSVPLEISTAEVVCMSIMGMDNGP